MELRGQGERHVPFPGNTLVPGELAFESKPTRKIASFRWGRRVGRPGEYWANYRESVAMRVKFPRRALLPQRIATYFLAGLAAALSVIVVGISEGKSRANDGSMAIASLNDEQLTQRNVEKLSNDQLFRQITLPHLSESRVLLLMQTAAQRKIPDLDLAVVQQLDHPSYSVRLQVLELLMRSKKAIYLESFARHLIDRDSLVRTLAAQALGQSGNPQMIVALTARVAVEESPEVRKAISHAIGRLSMAK